MKLPKNTLETKTFDDLIEGHIYRILRAGTILIEGNEVHHLKTLMQHSLPDGEDFYFVFPPKFFTMFAMPDDPGELNNDAFQEFLDDCLSGHQYCIYRGGEAKRMRFYFDARPFGAIVAQEMQKHQLALQEGI